MTKWESTTDVNLKEHIFAGKYRAIQHFWHLFTYSANKIYPLLHCLLAGIKIGKNTMKYNRITQVIYFQIQRIIMSETIISQDKEFTIREIEFTVGVILLVP